MHNIYNYIIAFVNFSSSRKIVTMHKFLMINHI